MTFTDWARSLELTSGTSTLTAMDKWLWTDFSTQDPVPKTVRYYHHPRVSPSNPQLPRTRHNKTFRGHQFKVGRSKK